MALAESLSGGFADPPRDAAHAFRAIMTAMARPGTCQEVAGVAPPDGLSPAAGAVILTLCDPDTGLWLSPTLNTEEIRNWIAFHTGAPFVPPQEAMFLVGPWAEMPLAEVALGTPDYPDRSATLVIEQEALSATGARLTGPGIETEAHLNLPEIAAFQDNARKFPLGFDAIFCAGATVAALPRSTKVEAA